MNRPRFRRFFRHGLLTQLIAFEACLRLGGVTRAAEELCLAQPTVSGLLKRLADTFGAPLMHARGGRIELTQAGHEVAELCREILGTLERFEHKLDPRLRGDDNVEIGDADGFPPRGKPSASPISAT